MGLSQEGAKGKDIFVAESRFFFIVRWFECVFGFVMVMEAVRGCLRLADSPLSLPAFLCITTLYLVLTNPKRPNAP